ncbi:response regulator [Cohnella candidum]|uniref:Response regulator n=1 Tax=Cohnella candidum TaxID=2674991 RepID=A0A3G3JVR0_9BACL|nr:response regulator [Cohnella candidum]AYQ71589.1 response regulator [Cohnella candidum]
MKKVMLVDDEIVIRENIRACIDWEKEGFIYCGDASDGEMALPMIDEWRPDILITDIKMPFMDGIELSSIVRQRLPDTKIIILSGHDEFSYARTALRIGVEEYFLKPISSADLVALLHTVGRKIDRERREKRKPAFTREKLLGDLCGGLIAETEAREAAQALSLPLSASHYAAVVWDLRCPDNGSSPDEAALHAAQYALEERAVGYGDMWRYSRSRTEEVWILRGNSPEEISALLEKLHRETLPELERSLPCSVAIGTGSVQDRLQGIHASFLKAEEDRSLRRLARQNKHALWETIGDEREIPFLDRPRYLEFLKIGTPADADRFIRDFAEALRGMDWNASLYGYYALNDLTLETLQEAKRTLRLAEDPHRALDDLQRQIKEIRSWETCAAYLRALADAFWEWRSESSGKYGDMIAKVKEFIRERYGDDGLSLQHAAEHVCVSPSHLSKVFSQETGQTFIECLTQTRIRKAMELLQTTNDRTYEIAYSVGYGDAHYFSNLFKKTTGLSPREYRRQGKESAGPEGASDDDDDRSA